ncbi:MAG: hypothetical protein R6X23_12095 [Acidimicrobiia bacterium]
MSGSIGGRWLDLPEPTIGAVLGGVTGALSATAEGPTPLQWDLLTAVARHVLQSSLVPQDVPRLAPDELAAAVTDPGHRALAVHLMVTLELALHPVPAEIARSVGRYARAVDVAEPMVEAARRFADHQLALMYLDIQRSSEFTERTISGIRHGRFLRLLRNKLAYENVLPDRQIAARWRALDSCPEGSWGRAVAAFYHEHRFPYPGERRGISEVGARHDWVHVLAGYPPTPEGEIDVFALIAAASPDPRGFTQFAMTLGLFQNGAIHHVAGKRIVIARTDTLADPGAPDRWADALRRGAACAADVLNLDHFAWKDIDLEDARSRLSLGSKQVPDP